MINAKEIYAFLDECFPYRIAEKSDNSGLIAGDLKQDITKVLITLDITFDVINEAINGNFNLILSHHPIVYDAIKMINANDYIGKKLYLLIKNNIVALSCHTNLDIAENGMNDHLASLLELKKVKPFLKTGSERSSFGQEKDSFLGRMGEVEKTTVDAFAKKAKEKLGCEGLRYCDCGKPVNKVAVIGGSGASFFIEVLKAGADTFVTGDAKYSNFLPAKEMGLNIIDAGHFHTESIILSPLKGLLQKAFPQTEFVISQTNKDCIRFI